MLSSVQSSSVANSSVVGRIINGHIPVHQRSPKGPQMSSNRFHVANCWQHQQACGMVWARAVVVNIRRQEDKGQNTGITFFDTMLSHVATRGHDPLLLYAVGFDTDQTQTSSRIRRGALMLLRTPSNPTEFSLSFSFSFIIWCCSLIQCPGIVLFVH